MTPDQPALRTYSASLLSYPSARQLSQDVPAEAGFLCDKAAVFRDKIKGTSFISQDNKNKRHAALRREHNNSDGRYEIKM